MKAALFVHLVSVIVGFGAVLSVDWAGLWWILGKRKLDYVVQIASNVQPLIWLGFTGLVLSGIFLHPNLHRSRTIIKLIAVIIVGLNGINLHFVNRASKKLANKKIAETPFWYIAWSGTSIMISQLAWWTAIIIGFMTANHI